MIAGKYEVRGVLGEGATGIVYDAVGPNGVGVALKVMHPMLAGDQQIRGRFQREAAILRRLDGAHVCPILEFGEATVETAGETAERTLLYIALPRVEGPSLAEVLARGPIDVDRAIAIELEILDALASAHAHGIIHRDLKPANVLLKSEKSVVVVDFGMAKIVTGAGAGTTSLTAHNMVFGTPEYMSPEQARGDNLDPRCDVYAAGVILHEMITGAQPFTGATPLSVLTAHLTSDLVPPSSRPGAAGRITPALEAVIVRALARERDRRYSSAGAFAQALRAAQKQPGGGDAFAATLPASVVGGASTEVDANATTLVDGEPRARPGDRAPAPDSTLVSSTPVLPTAPASTKASDKPSKKPTVPLAPTASGMTPAWIAVWIVVALLSIGAGVWFALR